MATPEKNSVPAATVLPGVPAGNPPAPKLAPTATPGERAGLAGHATPLPPKLPFGGNAGRKTRLDGYKPGSPEAIQADRDREARRKKNERAAKRAVTPPPALPSATPPAVHAVADANFAPAVGVDGVPVDAVVQWTAEDLRQCSVELVELIESWRVDSHSKHAAAGKLPAIVVEQIARDAAFPPASKKSLSTSSPATLAKAFNALNVPIALKSIITTAPALAYLIVRDLQTSSRIEKLIAESKATSETENKSV